MPNLAKQLLRRKAPPEKLASVLMDLGVLPFDCFNSLNGRRNVVWRVSDHLDSLS